MYLTAHRVMTPGRRVGVNAWLHRHATASWPRSLEDLLDLIQTDPGEPVEQSLELPPGGNKVLAHLDILAPEGTALEVIREAIARLEALDPEGSPLAFLIGPMAVRMGVVRRRRPDWSTDVAALGNAVLALLKNHLERGSGAVRRRRAR